VQLRRYGAPPSAERLAAIRCALGRSQVVRQRILIPPFPGSNPGAPAILSLCGPFLPREKTSDIWARSGKLNDVADPNFETAIADNQRELHL
jgi:hypothetical protein